MNYNIIQNNALPSLNLRHQQYKNLNSLPELYKSNCQQNNLTLLVNMVLQTRNKMQIIYVLKIIQRKKQTGFICMFYI